MVEPLTNETILIYGFGLFFVFLALVVLVVRYSNQMLIKKFVNVYEQLKHTQADLRKLAETQMRDKQHFEHEIRDLKKEIENTKQKHAEKQKIHARSR